MVRVPIGSTTLNSLGAVSQIACSALSGTECGYFVSEITDEYSRNRYITKKVNYIYYKAILDMETLSTEVIGSHFVKTQPSLFKVTFNNNIDAYLTTLHLPECREINPIACIEDLGLSYLDSPCR